MSINILYLLSGSLAIYSIEMADTSQPWHVTGLIALLLALIPAAFDALLLSEKFRLTKEQVLADKE